MAGIGSAPGERRGGRQKGTPNKMSKTIRDAVLSSFERIGAEEYLIRQSAENPVAYMSLLGKILPTQVTGADGNALVVEVVTGIFRSHEPGED